jgi:hypothetical protein
MSLPVYPKLPGSRAQQLDGDHNTMEIYFTPLLSLIAGVLILVVPRLLNYVVAAYLIVIGVAGLLGLG